jgi:TonB family protein
MKRIILAMMLIITTALAVLSCSSVARKTETKNPFEKQPEMIYSARPEYPLEARARRLSGEVWVKVFVDSLGEITESYVVKPSEFPNVGFEESALAAARQSKWKAAIVEGKPAGVWVTYKIVFNRKR